MKMTVYAQKVDKKISRFSYLSITNHLYLYLYVYIYIYINIATSLLSYTLEHTDQAKLNDAAGNCIARKREKDFIAK
jgi:hypothetical protein